MINFSFTGAPAGGSQVHKSLMRLFQFSDQYLLGFLTSGLGTNAFVDITFQQVVNLWELSLVFSFYS